MRCLARLTTGSLAYRRLAVADGHLGVNSVLELRSCATSGHAVSLKTMLSVRMSSQTKRAVPLGKSYRKFSMM
jgi:hypothetical protein